MILSQETRGVIGHEALVERVIDLQRKVAVLGR
jgi:hypothetical protein